MPRFGNVEPPEAESDINILRSDNVRKTIRVSLVSKIIGGVLQLGAVPVAIARLGDEYVVFSALVVLMSTFSTLNLGIGPGLAMELSHIAHSKDESEERKIFMTSLILVLLFASVLGIIGLLIAALMPMNWIFPEDLMGYSHSLRTGIYIVVIYGIMMNFVLPIGAVYTGLLQDYRVRTVNLVGYGLSLLATLYVAWRRANPLLLLTALYVVQVLPMIWLSWKLLYKERPYLLGGLGNFSKEIFKRMLSSNLASTAVQFGDYITLSVSVLVIGQMTNHIELSRVQISVLMLGIMMTLVDMITGSVWPGVRSAIATSDWGWISKTAKKAGLFLAGLSLITILGSLTIGERAAAILYRSYGMSWQEMGLWSLCFTVLIPERIAQAACTVFQKLWVSAVIHLSKAALVMFLIQILPIGTGVSRFLASMILATVVAWIAYLVLGFIFRKNWSPNDEILAS